MNIQLSAKNSLVGKIKIFVVCLYLTTFTAISIYNIYYDLQKELISLNSLTKSQIEIILAENEDLKNQGMYSRICGKIFNLNNVKSVIILDKYDKPLCKSPLIDNQVTYASDFSFLVNDISEITHILIDYSLDYHAFFQKFLISFLLNILILLFGIFFLNLIFNTYLKSPISRVQKIIKNIYDNDFSESCIDLPLEFIPILNSLANSQHNLKKSEKALVATEKHRAIATIATQVAHDIRSPLAALNMMMKDVLTLPEDKRIIMRSAVTRIQDIANDLLSKNRQIQMFDDGDATTFLSQGTQFAPEDDELQTVLLHGVLESIVSEKRIQYRGNPGISIDLQLDSDSYGIFASIQVREFKRVMSNLVNNAVEAEAKMETLSPSIGEHTRQHLVTITSRRDRDDKEVRKGLILEITDNGRGIHPEVLAQISGEDQGGQWRRRSFGKLSGNGIGLFHAKKTIENWGGQLTINSGGVGLGTTVQIRLPEQEAPVYFLPELVLEASMEVVAVDDDYSIHQIWHGRLESLRARDKNIRFRSFTDLKQFMIWHAEQTPRPSSHHYLYLVDYEFLGEEANGIDIIECLRLQPAGGQTILVTSRHEEEAVIARCEQLKIKLLPKGLAGFVPMQIHSSAHRSDNNLHILVDDDQLIRIVWQAKAKEKGIHLLVFASGEELLSRPQFAATFCQKTTIFYLDANLGDSGMRGEDLAQELFHRGFEQLYLATGYDCNQFSHFNLSFIRGVIGKIAPW